MKAKVICMASAKGGSGKTSLTATVGTFLSKLQKTVLLIDADSATNGLTLLFLKEIRVNAELVHSTGRSPMGLFDRLAADTPTRIRTKCDVVQLAEYLDFIPASYGLRTVPLIAGEEVVFSMRDLLSELRATYDYIFIDAQAGTDDMALVVMNRTVSDEVVIVSEYDPMSAAGVERLKAMQPKDLTYDRTWVLLNKILPEFAKSFGDFMEVAKYLPPIPWDAEVVRAYARRRLAINTDTGTDHTLSVLQTLKALFGESIEQSIDEWVRSKAAVIKAPLEQQYLDAEREMAALLGLKRNASARTMFLVKLIVLAAAALIPGLFILFQASNWEQVNQPGVYVVMGFVSITGLILIFGLFGLFRRFGNTLWGGDDVGDQIHEARLDRQLALLKSRLESLELLRTLDAQSLLKRRRSLEIETPHRPPGTDS